MSVGFSWCFGFVRKSVRVRTRVCSLICRAEEGRMLSHIDHKQAEKQKQKSGATVIDLVVEHDG